MLPTLHPSWARFVFFTRSCDLLFEVAAELPGELVSPCSDGEGLEVQSLKQKTDFFFPITFLLSPTISVLRLNHHKNPGTGKNTFLILPRAAGSRVIFYTSVSRRGVCIIAWKSGKNLPVWEAVSGKNEAPFSSFGKCGEWKAAGREPGFRGKKNTEKKKSALKQENSLLEEKE